jgi:hypothetical protein
LSASARRRNGEKAKAAEKNGCYAADISWKIRGWVDQLVGSPGLRRGRRDSEVVGYGEALLEFRIEARNDHQCVLHQLALLCPRGLFGLAYWYSVLQFHAIVFRGMLSGIEREALKAATSPQNMVSESST